MNASASAKSRAKVSAVHKVASVQQQKQQIKSSALVFNCTQENLKRGLDAVSGMAGKSVSLPILTHVLLRAEQGKLTLATTDLEIALTARVPGKTEAEGVVAVPFRALHEFVVNLPAGTLVLRAEKNALTVEAPQAQGRFQGEAADNFPLIPTLTEGQHYTLPAAGFVTALQRVLYAAATDDARPEIGGIWLNAQDGQLVFAATDSYRLAEAVLPAPQVPAVAGVLIPRKAALELARVFSGEEEIKLQWGEGHLMVESAALVLLTRLIDATFPDYRAVIPRSTSTSVVMSRLSLQQAIRAASVFSRDVAAVTLTTEDKGLRVAADVEELGSTEMLVEGRVEGKATARFNPRFILEALQALGGEEIYFGFSDDSSPAIMRPWQSKRQEPVASPLAVIMPMKE